MIKIVIDHVPRSIVNLAPVAKADSLSCAADAGGAEVMDGAEDMEFEDADEAGMDDFDDDADMNDEDMLDEEEIAEAVEAEGGQMQLQIIDEQAFQEVVNDLAAADPASAAALR